MDNETKYPKDWKAYDIACLPWLEEARRRPVTDKSVKRLWLAVLLGGICESFWDKKYEIIPTEFIKCYNYAEGKRTRPVKWKLVEVFRRNQTEYRWTNTDMFNYLCQLIPMAPKDVRKRIEKRPEDFHEDEVVIHESDNYADLKRLRRKLWGLKPLTELQMARNNI